jgi:hypothetical protein
MKELASNLQEDRSHQNPKSTERIVRFPRLPRRFPRLPIRRFPRLGPEDLAALAKAERLAALDERAFEWIVRGRPANLELGRVFNQIKDILEHGEWKPYFTNKFLPRGIAFRTAQDYMKMAGEADEITKNANPAHFPPATDSPAIAIRHANEADKAEVATVGEQPSKSHDKEGQKPRKKRVRLDGIYNLPLFMTGELKDATDLLLKSKKWARAERKIMDLLQHQLIKYGFLNNSEKKDKNETN